MSKNSVLNTYNFVSTSNRQLNLDSNKYELIIRQQPKQARLCSSKERDRRPVDPPPIIQLKVNGYGEEAQNFLQSPYYFMCANLEHPTDNGESFTVSSRYLAGTVVSSLHKLKDVDNKDGGFFVFGDISVRVEGRYRLRFSLFEIIRDEVVHIISVVSDVFTVYSPKSFPGMSESTFLSRSFSDQGVRIRIRKEHRIQMKRPQSHSRQSDNAECDDDDNANDDGNTDIPVKRKRSKSQIIPVSTFKTVPPLELLDTSSSMSYPQSQQSSFAPSSNSPYQQFHKFPSRQGGGSLSYPPPPFGYSQQQSPPQRQSSYYEEPHSDRSLSSSYNYGCEYNEQSMLNKRPRLSSSELTTPYDYRHQPTVTSLNNTNNTNHHHYNTSPLPPPPPHHHHPLPPPHSSSSSYHSTQRLSPLLEHQSSYSNSSVNNSSNRNPSFNHRSFDVLASSASLDSSLHYSATTTSESPKSQHISPSEPFYRSSSSSTQPFHPRPPVRSRTLPPYVNNNNNDDDNNNMRRYNQHHQDSTTSLSSSIQLPTPKTSIDNKKPLYSSYSPLTPPNQNGSSSVDNLAPSFTQNFTLSPRPGPLQLPSKSPLSSNNEGVTKTNSLPVMPSNSNTSSSSSTATTTTTTFFNNGGVLTSSPQLLPTSNNNIPNVPRLPPITSITESIDFMNKKNDKFYNDGVQRHQQGQRYYSMDDKVWHKNEW